MTYEQCTEFLFERTPMFQSLGPGAYKPGLETVTRLSEAFGSPHKGLRCIHVGGTNGKGSTAHTLAAVLQSAGYRTGLYTSPHLTDFRERIRIDGRMISRDEVCDFVDRFNSRPELMELAPTFFELTTVMAFEHFARHKVDVAVIEVGLGGRLDSTNIISPDLSVITNISLDHTALLGHSEPEIAAEKAGIIKPGVPVVIGESEGEVREVFAHRAVETESPIYYADSMRLYDEAIETGDIIRYTATAFGDIDSELTGGCQRHNAATILCALQRLKELGYRIDSDAVRRGFADVCGLTGLMGRWMKVGDRPMTVCDTGHNPGGWQYLGPRLAAEGRKLHMVIGFVNDKDISTIIGMMPREAHYYFVTPSVKRGLNSVTLTSRFAEAGINGECFPTMADGYKKALSAAGEGDMIFVGGSTFVVADLLSYLSD